MGEEIRRNKKNWSCPIVSRVFSKKKKIEKTATGAKIISRIAGELLKTLLYVQNFVFARKKKL